MSEGGASVTAVRPRLDSIGGVDSGETKQGLNTWRLAALTFFTVSGGPYGLEPLVSTIGPFYSILGLLIVPWVWGLPTAFMTAEMASSLPEMGGYIVWVQRTMGDFWAFQNGMWNIFSNCLDNALYPVMFVDYIEQMVGHEFGHWTRFSIGATMVALLGLVNIIGVDVVGDGAGVFGIFVLAPFLVMVIIGFASGDVDTSDWSRTIETPDIGLFVSLLLWNTCGYDSAGTCAAEVENPGKIYPRAMVITIVVTTLVYVLPIMVGVSVAEDYSLWNDGYFVIIGELIGGYPLKLFILVAGCVSALGLLNSTMCTSSRALACIAGFGYAPKFLARIHPRYGTPITAIFTNSAMIIAMVATGLNFESIAQLSMWLYALTLVFEFVALILLRKNEPNLERPYRIPTGLCGLVILSIPPCVCCGILMFLSKPLTWVICGAICSFSFLCLIPYYAINGKPFQAPCSFFGMCYVFKKVRVEGGELGDPGNGDLAEDLAGLELSSNHISMLTDQVDLVQIDLNET
mmetsp:Transcript_4981/g.7551  ORF Transcript_4981/g.7551 Transcript_4981/m.7551 type:complete len:517 (-) Transcript_4981:27-1577(-)